MESIEASIERINREEIIHMCRETDPDNQFLKDLDRVIEAAREWDSDNQEMQRLQSDVSKMFHGDAPQPSEAE